MDRKFHPLFYGVYEYLSMVGLKYVHGHKQTPKVFVAYDIYVCTNENRHVWLLREYHRKVGIFTDTKVGYNMHRYELCRHSYHYPNQTANRWWNHDIMADALWPIHFNLYICMISMIPYHQQDMEIQYSFYNLAKVMYKRNKPRVLSMTYHRDILESLKCICGICV